jgi:thioredoxin-related protein
VRGFLLFILSVFTVSGVFAQQKVKFSRHTWYAAAAEAREKNRFVFFYISQPGCDYCREFDKTTLRNPEVRNLLQSRFLTVRHSVSTPYGEAFARDFHLTHTPAVLLLNPRRSENPDIFGEIYDTQGFLQILRNWVTEQEN